MYEVSMRRCVGSRNFARWGMRRRFFGRRAWRRRPAETRDFCAAIGVASPVLELMDRGLFQQSIWL